VLIIDDDPELCEEIMDIFKDEGYDAVCTLDPYEGVSIIEKDAHDVILLDYKMPGLTGVDILKRIRNKNLQAKIFIVSGRPFVEKLIKEEGLSGMIVAVIPKPIDLNDLLEKVRAA
jgi:two-component system response regulator (stage 0 sporulation protein F)